MTLSEKLLDEFRQRRVYHYANLLDDGNSYDRELFERYTRACEYLVYRKDVQDYGPRVANMLAALRRLPAEERAKVQEQLNELLNKNRAE